MSFFYLSFVLEEQDPIPVLGYILALIVFIVVSHDALLQIIVQATGQSNTRSELEYFSAFIELNRKIHNFLEVDDVLVLVNDTLKERVQVHKTVYLVTRELSINQNTEADPARSRDSLNLRGWPDNVNWGFLTRDFEEELEGNPAIQSFRESSPVVRQAFAETGTNLMVPVVQNDKVLGVIFVGRLDNQRPYSEFEFQMYSFLANQLSIILDRIRVYAKVMQKTVMDHAEKMQVMQSLSANIAHEMRTPLSGIRASISGFEEYLPPMLEAYTRCSVTEPGHFHPLREDMLNRLQGTPRRIQLMIDQANNVIDMLLMNLRDNSLDRKLLEKIDASEMVAQAVDRYPFKTGERDKLYLHLDENFSFLGVESLCIYILFNLMKNAFYSLQSAQKGEIHLSLRRGDKQNFIIFRDTGLGIDRNVVGRIFDGFFTTKTDGTGAGLAFCKRTINSFGGDISCRSEAGEFAEFLISLPQVRSH